MNVCPSCGRMIRQYNYWLPQNAYTGYYFGACDLCNTQVQIKEEDIMKKRHWLEDYLGQYAEMDLIDRKELLEKLDLDTEEKVKKQWDAGVIDEQTIDILSYINGAKEVDPTEIVLEYLRATEKEKKTNP